MKENQMSSETLAEKCGKIAELYDNDKETQRWNGPNVIFGLSFAYMEPGQTILDIGIGTGLSSLLFYKAGLKVYGMDLSSEMLAVCKKKGIAEELRNHDLTTIPYPYSEGSIDHAMCVGVLNHFENIEPVFCEASRILKDKSIFGLSLQTERMMKNPCSKCNMLAPVTRCIVIVWNRYLTTLKKQDSEYFVRWNSWFRNMMRMERKQY